MDDPTGQTTAKSGAPAPAAGARAPGKPLDQQALQILSTEHWGLLSERSLAYNESFTRAGMFLTFLSMSFVALALLAQATGFSGDFIAIAVIVLAFNLFIGMATFARILITWVIDGRTVQGMNRIRHAYLEISPAAEPYFVTGSHDDEAGVARTYGIPAGAVGGVLAGIAYGLSTALGMVAVIVAFLGGVLVGLLSASAGGSLWLAIGAGGVTAVFVFAAQMGLAARILGQAALPARFPTPEEAMKSDDKRSPLFTPRRGQRD